MSIQNKLDALKQADFGGEVRDTIHAALEKTYEDATKEGNANMEVSQARGTHSTLKGRLDNTDGKVDETNAQLAHKVGQGVKADLEDLSETVLAAIEAGEGTTFNLLSIPQDNSVTISKLSPQLQGIFIEEGAEW